MEWHVPRQAGDRMHGIYEDVRRAFRLMAANRALSAAVFLSLALGIGVSTATFSIVNYVALQRLPVPETERVVRVTSASPESQVDEFSYPDFADLRKGARAFEALASAEDEAATVDPHTGASPRMTLALVVSGDFFRVMRLEPVLGRVFRPEEDEEPNRDRVALISYEMWQRDFGGRRDILGKTIRVNATEFTVIGVVSRSFVGVNVGGVTFHSQFYVPRMMVEAMEDPGLHPLTDRSNRNVDIWGRLKRGASLEQAQVEVRQIAAQLEGENPATDRRRSMNVYTQLGWRRAMKPGSVPMAVLFLFLGALPLVIACVNVGCLMLSSVPARARESAVRLALGASPTRLLGQFLVESCLLAIAAGALGLGIAGLAAAWLRTIEVGSRLLPININVEVDLRVALFALVVGAGSGVVSGLVPAIRCAQGDLDALMRSGGPRVSRSRSPFRQLLVAGQVALATVVLVVSGLALESLSALRRADPGFRVNDVLTMAFSPIQSRGFTISQSHQFYDQLVERVREIPGVESAALGHHVPLGIESLSNDVAIEGYAMPPGQKYLSIASGIVGEKYFETLGIPILRGRSFTPHDTGSEPKVGIVNQAMAEKYWPAGNALGKRIEIGGPKPSSVEIVGIARTAKYRSLTEQPLPFLYLPLSQTEETFMYLFVDTKGDPDSFLPAVRRAAREIDPLQGIYDIHTMRDAVRRQALFEVRIQAQVATGAGAISVMLSLLGLYAILAYSVSQRRREIGIRMAVGATHRRIFGMIVGQGLKLSLAGIAAGLFLASSLASATSQFLTPANPEDPVIYAAVAAFVAGVTLLSFYDPARRAARIDPNEFLRSE
jgi:macrolide transport system ATP-binding/permease protein